MSHSDPPGWDGIPSWSGGAADGLVRTAETVAPVVYPPDERVGDDFHLWDTWLLRTRDGSVATPGGVRVIFALTAPDDLLPGKRHDAAEIRCLYSPDGRTWRDAGPAFEPDGPLGSRQWAGSALFEPDSDDPSRGDVTLYYTAAGEANETELSYTQRLAAGTDGRLRVTDETARLDRSWRHETVLRPDGDRYETQAQSRGMIYTFRDPWFFEDPATGETHLLFEANVPVSEDSDRCGGDTTAQSFNGCVGVATSPDGSPTTFEPEAPLLHSVCVNQELERPHVVVHDGRYYLFVSSHRHTFAPGFDGFDALYGFVADDLRGDYRPLNDTGLVVTNPANAPYQTYSWLAYPHAEELLVTSFFNYYDLGGMSLDDVADLPRDEQFARFGGTLAPTLRVALSGDETRILGTLDHGHLPTRSESLPSLPAETATQSAGGYGGAPTVVDE
ncbi:glycoside hydrolase family 68 protein [Halobaculum sp. MBLA0143]|uniref:glycoside hydrolase family 68 protein n=1 Tax=Halobaculum sp. MBLA0143 TaxID=3079933 RepID=UPI003526423C